MPSLPSALAESANESAQTSGDFKPLDPGIYTVRLNKCDATQSRGTPPKPMWALEFDTIYDLETNRQNGRLWSNITLEESVAWKIAQLFEAFGVPTTTNTDELINIRIRVDVTQRVQTFGKNQGKLVNEIGRFLPLIEGDPGYDKAQQLKAKLTKPAKPAMRKQATPAAATAPVADDVEVDSVVDDDPDAIEF